MKLKTKNTVKWVLSDLEGQCLFALLNNLSGGAIYKALDNDFGESGKLRAKAYDKLMAVTETFAEQYDDDYYTEPV